MAEPRAIVVRPSRWCPTVWTVDDAWFEGGGTAATGAGADVPAIFPEDASKKTTFAELGKSVGEANELVKYIEGVGQVGAFLPMDLPFIAQLVELCREKGLALVVCNFEYCDENFTLANAPRTAVLLDINYSKIKEGEKHGISLLERKLNGRRPQADIFFVTSARKVVEDHIGLQIKSGASSAWPLKTVPIVDKQSKDGGPPIEEELTAFFNYFVSGLGTSRPLELLAESMLQAYEADGHGHLSNADVAELPLQHILAKENARALFQLQSLNVGSGAKRTDVPLSGVALLKLLENNGLDASAAKIVRLPQPGMLFLLGLIRLVRECNDPGPGRERIVRLEFAERSVSLVFSGGGPVAILGASVGGKPNGAAEALRHLVAGCARPWINSLRNDGAKREASAIFAAWKKGRDRSSLAPWPTIDATASGCELTLGW